MKKLIHLTFASFIILLGFNCSEEERIDYTDSNAPAPLQVTNIKVEALPGAANIIYQIPRDPNLSYVKAVYEIQPGVFRETKSSIYTDTLTVVGFANTSIHEIKIYSVGKNGKSSESISVEVKPDTPPVKTAFENVDIQASFSGIRVSFENELKAKLGIVIMVDSVGNGKWVPLTTFYTGAEKGAFSVRGLSATEKRFAVFLKDRWDNKSDTLVKDLTPLFEQLIPKNDFRVVKLEGDTWESVSGLIIENLWDDRLSPYIFATNDIPPMPKTFTIDLGMKVILSRLKEFQFADHVYNYGSVKAFELWGSNDPDADGGWDNWQLLGKFDSFKPSGEPLGIVTPEDRNYAVVNGEDFEFQSPPPPVRYLRWKTLSTYNRLGQVVIAELTFWGQIVP